ncbi:MAG TPA: isoaspartyl peptidase/L-asparaginase [Labilithrix sp.]|nr:isoaspartyl peptidase/L-asparaginase [Labilithrix sp.]
MSTRAEATDRDASITGSWGAAPASWSLLVHGGAGDVPQAALAARIAGCERAAAEGAKILAAGGSALDAVQRAVEVLESDPLFNAATGACLDADGRLALDASIMDGASLRAGAVCALPAFEHPIAIARRVMDDTPHVLLAAEGARRFAVACGFTPAAEETMVTEASRKRWEIARTRKGVEAWAGGTVGAVARDTNGHVAAATSTGGMVNKLVGRVGDSPLIGAGTYADDESGACSTTGHGEAMIRVVAAKSAVDAMRDALPEASARATMAHMHTRTAQTGGVILVGKDGSLGLARTTRTMTWAAARSESDAPSASGS